MTEVTMRVEGGARMAGADGAGADAGRFDEALARAGRSGAARGDGARAERGEGARAGGARSRPELRAPAAWRRGGDEAGALGAGEELCAAATAAAERGRGGPGAELAPAPELAAVVRVLPPAVASLGPPGAAPLALSFGRSLDVELRATPAGVDVVLRPAPGLARAAEAELPRLVAALRVRGVTVARAEVRPRGQPGGRAR